MLPSTLQYQKRNRNLKDSVMFKVSYRFILNYSQRNVKKMPLLFFSYYCRSNPDDLSHWERRSHLSKILLKCWTGLKGKEWQGDPHSFFPWQTFRHRPQTTTSKFSEHFFILDVSISHIVVTASLNKLYVFYPKSNFFSKIQILSLIIHALTNNILGLFIKQKIAFFIIYYINPMSLYSSYMSIAWEWIKEKLSNFFCLFVHSFY